MAGAPSGPMLLKLGLACGSAAWLEREPARQAFRLERFEASPDFSRRRPLPNRGAALAGFGPYPHWDANRAARVASVPEAGGMMEGEHAFILTGQFLFLEGPEGPSAFGPIRSAAWEPSTSRTHSLKEA